MEKKLTSSTGAAGKPETWLIYFQLLDHLKPGRIGGKRLAHDHQVRLGQDVLCRVVFLHVETSYLFFMNCRVDGCEILIFLLIFP